MCNCDEFFYNLFKFFDRFRFILISKMVIDFLKKEDLM